MQMKIHAQQNDVQEISMPKLACGRDQLNWIIVESMIKNEFSDTNITINVYHLGKDFLVEKVSAIISTISLNILYS